MRNLIASFFARAQLNYVIIKFIYDAKFLSWKKGNLQSDFFSFFNSFATLRRCSFSE